MKITIVDDDRIVCTSLKKIIEADGGVEVAGIGYSGDDAVRLYEKFRPDISLMDIRMEGMTGLAAAEKILKRFKDARILFLTTFADDDYIVKALNIGAKGYILKQDYESIVPSLMAVQSGQRVFGDDIVSKLPSMIGTCPNGNLNGYGLIDREIDIIRLVADGMVNRDIAKELFLSEGTVRNYLSTIFEKLNIKSRTQLAVFYYKNLYYKG